MCLFVFLVDMRIVKRTPLIYAAMNGHYKVMAFLLRLGVNPDAPDHTKSTAMHYAAAHGWYHCVQLLLEAGAAPNVINEFQVRIHQRMCTRKMFATQQHQLRLIETAIQSD